MSGHPMPGSDDPAVRDLGYNDVKSAWEYYLHHENHGRGVVLVGHSQGSVILDRLIASEVDGKPAQALLVSAILMGWNVAVPAGADVGGDFASVPLCRRASQTGCAIAFASFRATSPPPPNSVFGRPVPPRSGMVAACVNPAALAGGAGELKAYFGSTPQQIAGLVAGPTRWGKDLTVTTPYVSVPGLLSAECVTTDQFSYLAVSVHADPAGARTSDIPGDLVRDGVVRPEWGLHLIDANLTIGNLLDIVDAESRAWVAKSSAKRARNHHPGDRSRAAVQLLGTASRRLPPDANKTGFHRRVATEPPMSNGRCRATQYEFAVVLIVPEELR